MRRKLWRNKRLKYSVLRYVAATGWGAVGMTMSVCALWMFTQLRVEYIIFYSLFVYSAIIGSVLLASDKPKAKRRRRSAPVRKPRQFKMYDMKEGRWDAQ